MSRKQFFALAVLVSVCSLIGGALGSEFWFTDATAQVPQSVLAAKAFLLVDESGTVRAEMGLTDNQPFVVFYSQDRNKAAIMGIQSDGTPGMTLIGKEALVLSK